jgi:HK97 family phage major capsid protein
VEIERAALTLADFGGGRGRSVGARGTAATTECGGCGLELAGGYPAWRAHWDQMHQEVETQMSTTSDQAARRTAELTGQRYEQSPATNGELRRLADRLEGALASLRPSDVPAEVIPGFGQVRGGSRVLLQHPALADPAYADAYHDWIRRGEQDMDQRARRQLLEVTDFAEEVRLAAGTGSSGGYLIPPGFLQRLAIGQKRASGMLRACGATTTSGGQSATWPHLDDTGTVGTIVGEAAALSVDASTPFTQKTVGAFMYNSKIVQVSWQLAQDSSFPIESWLPAVLGARIGRAANAHFTTGTGAGAQPTGIQPGVTVGRQGAVGTTTTITYGDLEDTLHSVDAAYREDEPPDGIVGWVLSDAALRMCRKATGAPAAPVVNDDRRTLLGFPYVLNNDMPVPAASVKSIIFGHWPAGYMIRRVIGDATVLRLSELFAGTGQIGWIGFQRLDGVPADPAALRAFQQSAT